MDLSVTGIQPPGDGPAMVRVLATSKEGTLQVATLLLPSEARAIARALMTSAEQAERAIVPATKMPRKTGLIS